MATSHTMPEKLDDESYNESYKSDKNIFSALSPDKLTVSKSTVLRHHQVYASRNSLNSQRTNRINYSQKFSSILAKL